MEVAWAVGVAPGAACVGVGGTGVGVGGTGVGVTVAGLAVGVGVGVGVEVGVGVPPAIVTLPLTPFRGKISCKLLSGNSVMARVRAVLAPAAPTAVTFRFARAYDPEEGPVDRTAVRVTTPEAPLVSTPNVGVPLKGLSPPTTPVTASIEMMLLL